MMRIRCFTPGALEQGLLDAWRALQASDPSLASPFLGPDLPLAVEAAGGAVEVAVVEEGDAPVAFFPFARHGRSGRTGRAYAANLSDLEGITAAPGLALDARTLLEGCDLARFDFGQALASQPLLAPSHVTIRAALHLDLSQGFEAYKERRFEMGGRELKETLRKARKADRETGGLRLVASERDPRVLDVLLEWKASQLRALRLRNPIASTSWGPRLLRLLFERREESFGSALTALYLGDRLAAVSMGVRAGRILHGWVTAYEPELHRYSPGRLLLVELARQAEELGIERIEMGVGEEPYKHRFHTGSTAVATGSVHQLPILEALHRPWIRVREWAKVQSFAGGVRRFLDRKTVA